MAKTNDQQQPRRELRKEFYQNKLDLFASIDPYIEEELAKRNEAAAYLHSLGDSGGVLLTIVPKLVDMILAAGAGGGGGEAAGVIPGDGYPEKAWNFFAAKGFTAAAVAGLLGNFQHESYLNPTTIQSNGKGPGTGLVQWENRSGGRWPQLVSWAQANGKDEWAIDTQLEFLWMEMNGIKPADTWFKSEWDKVGGLNKLKTTTDYKEAVRLFEEVMERAGVKAYEKRYGYAKGFLDQFAAGNGSGTASVIDSATTVPGDFNPGGVSLIGITGGQAVIPTGARGTYQTKRQQNASSSNYKGFIKMTSPWTYDNSSQNLMAPDYAAVMSQLMAPAILKATGWKKITVTSGLRRGDKKAHGSGHAVDIQCHGMKECLKVADACWSVGLRGVAIGGNVGGGGGFVHVDGGPPGSWDYGHGKYAGPNSMGSYR